jgi:hypothetical protein
MSACDHIPGDVPDDHPGLTPRVQLAIHRARLLAEWDHHTDADITDASGPHQHHWEPILWWCRGCGQCDPP